MSIISRRQMAPPPADGLVPRFFVRVHRQPRPRTPWMWAIYEKGRAEPCRRSTRFYRSADEAWTVGRTMLARAGKPAPTIVPGP